MASGTIKGIYAPAPGGEGAIPRLMAALAVNVGNLEGAVGTIENDYTEILQRYSEQQEILDLNDLGKRINRPNLLKQDFATQRTVPTSEVVTGTITIPAEDATAAAQPLTYTVTDTRITTNFVLYQAISSDWEEVPGSLVSAVCQAGTATITVAARAAHSGSITISYQLCTNGTRTVPYGETNRIYATSSPYIKSIRGNTNKITGEDLDEISVSVITLSGNDIIEEADGERYTQALAFSCATANTAWGNCEELRYAYGAHGGGTFANTDTPPKEYGSITSMEAGKTYTLSCWARVTSGTKMRIKFFCDAEKNHASNDTAFCNFQDVEGTEWQRYSWTFVFSPSGNQFTDTSTTITKDGETVAATKRTCNWTKTVGFGVSRGYAGTVQMCGFRLTAGRLNMNTTYDNVMDAIMALAERVNELEAIVLENA